MVAHIQSQNKKRDEKKVYELHFEKSHSALQIAEELDVNRHTIHEDIRYWYSELASEFEKLELKDLILRQYDRMETQRTRLIEMVQKEQNIHNILKIERLIFDLDCAIMKMILPIIQQKTVEIPDEEAVKIAEHLIVNDESSKAIGYSDKDLLRDIIKYKNCDITHAQKILGKIKSLGLDLYLHNDIMETKRYDLLGFAESRNILSNEKLQEIYSKIEKREQEQKEELAKRIIRDNEIEAKYVAKYGPKESWSGWVWAEFDEETNKFDSLP